MSIRSFKQVFLAPTIIIGGLVNVTGCQTGSTISVDDAKKVVAEFTESYKAPPPRSVSAVLEDWQTNISTKPVKCLEVEINGIPYEEMREIVYGMDRWEAAKTFQVNGYRRFLRGQVKEAVRFSEAVVQYTPSNWLSTAGYAYADVAFYEANVGNLTAAKIAMGNAYQGKYVPNNASWRAYGNFRRSRGEGAVARLEGDDIAALAHYLRAVEDMKGSLTDHQQVYGVIAEIVDIYRSRGELQNAESIALESLRRNSHGFYIVWPENSILLTRFSQVLFDLGRYDEAIAAAKLSTRLFDLGCIQPDSLFYSNARMVIGKSLVAKGDYVGGLEIFDKVRAGLSKLPEPQQKRINSDLSVGIAMLYSGQGAKAREVFEQAKLTLSDSASATEYARAEVAAFIAVSEDKLGNAGAAFQGLKKALPDLLGNSWERSADDTAFTARDSRLAAISHFYLEMLVKQQSIAKANGIDPIAESFLITQAVRGKRMERTFAASVARANVDDSELAKLVRGEQDAGKRRTKLNTQLIAALSSSDAKNSGAKAKAIKQRLNLTAKAQKTLRSEIVSRFPDYAELIDPSPLSIEDVQKAMAPDEALIVTFTTTNKTYIWAVPARGKAVFAKTRLGRKEMSDIIVSIRKSLEPQISTLADIPPFDVAASNKLYERLLKPVEAGWKSATSLHVVPHGPLGSLPMSVLVTKPVEVRSDTNLLFAENRSVAWLARSHAIAILPSVSALKTIGGTKSKLAASQPFVGFGDPYFSPGQALEASKEKLVELADASATRGSPVKLRSKPKTRAVDSANLALLPRLPETRWEVESIARTVGADPAKVTFTGKQANEERVKTMNLLPYRVVSFATHGLVPGDLDGLDQPALALTAPQVAGVDGDGMLTVDEILNLKLNADWAVLSACNTAAADGAGSEAVSGLGRAFFYAGARALLVSNWPVHSGATANLMTTLFHLQAKDRALGRSIALQKTRLQMIDQGTQKDAKGKPVFSYAHPIFWAPFTIVGDGGRTKARS